MNKTSYLKIQLKRASKIYPSILLITIITVLSIALTAGIILYTNINSSEKTKIKIGLVGDTTDSYFQVGIAAIENFDSSKHSVEFIELSEKRAQKLLKNHSISGYIRIPERYIQGILYGRNTPAEYVVLNDATGFETVIINEIASVVSDWVLHSQTSVYALDELTSVYGDSREKLNIDDAINKVNIANISHVIERTKAYKTVYIGVKDSLSMEGYYICGIITFFLLLWGVACNKLLIKTDFSLSRLLYSRGIKTPKQLFCEYMGYLIFTLLTLLAFAIILGAVLNFSNFGIKELAGKGVFSCILFVVKILPVIVMITTMQMFLYEIAPGTVNSIVLQLFVAIAFSYVSGCFYPNYFFPDSVEQFGAALPSGVGFSYISKCFTSTLNLKDLLYTLCYTFSFLMLTIIIRKHRLVGEKQ